VLDGAHHGQPNPSVRRSMRPLKSERQATSYTLRA
jgi:hypothetical protein